MTGPRTAALLVSRGAGGVAGGLLIVKVIVAFTVPPAFVAEIGTLNFPATVGVPEIKPDAFTPSPGGRFVALKLVGEFDALIARLNGLPTVALAAAAFASTGTGRVGAMVNVRMPLPIPPALLADRPTSNVPGVVGVPVIRPVVASMLRPGGKLLAAKFVEATSVTME